MIREDKKMNAKYDGYSFQMRDTVTRTKVQFHNRYGITLAGDLYLPKTYEGKLTAIAVAGPFGAVKEQSIPICMTARILFLLKRLFLSTKKI